jgi:hypothetical protein
MRKKPLEGNRFGIQQLENSYISESHDLNS